MAKKTAKPKPAEQPPKLSKADEDALDKVWGIKKSRVRR